MVYIYLWDGREFVCITKDGASREYLANLMQDPVWDEYEMCYLAW